MTTFTKPLYVDNHLIVCSKPAGLPVVPDESGDESLLDQAKAWIAEEYKKPGAVFLGVVHRLDRPVSGVVLFARTSKAAARLTKAFQGREVKKTYLGVGMGPVTAKGDEGELEQWVVKSTRQNRVRTYAEEPDVREIDPGEKPKLAKTDWRVLEEGDYQGAPVTRFLLQPVTGRSHQLRVACQTLGSPLLGDLKYAPRGAKPLDDKSIALHAYSLCIPHPTLKQDMTFVAALPDKPWWHAFPMQGLETV
ncbi:MAG: 23S rRNA pseudouridine1911/1915/1917 synthase [Planctomycetota bacterium]|jgi:23S rRNA pseudouridine1911/1915/1917 synthase